MSGPDQPPTQPGQPTGGWGPQGPPTAQWGPPPPAPAKRKFGVPIIAISLLAVVALTVGGLFLSGAFSTEVRVEPVAYSDSESFTNSVGNGAAVPAQPAAVPSVPALPTGGGAAGNQPGLYGGTGQNACDPNALVQFLMQHPDKAAAWAGVEGITVADIPKFVAGLTPAILRVDTAVTNHGFRNGKAYALNSILQAGTAVLVDDKGVPRARCKCGNPLLEGKQFSRTSYTGTKWSSFNASNVVIVQSSRTVINNFTFVNITTNTTYTIKSGSTVVLVNFPPTPTSQTTTECAYSDAGNGAPISSKPGATFTDSRGITYTVGNDCALTETKPAAECAYLDAGNGAPITQAKGATFTDSRGLSYTVGNDCALTPVAAPAPPSGGPSPAPSVPPAAPNPAPGPNKTCNYSDAGDGSPISAAAGSTFTDSRGYTYRVGGDCVLTELSAPAPQQPQAPAPPPPSQPSNNTPATCNYSDAGDGSPITSQEGSTFTDSRGKSYRVTSGCVLVEI